MNRTYIHKIKLLLHELDSGNDAVQTLRLLRESIEASTSDEIAVGLMKYLTELLLAERSAVELEMGMAEKSSESNGSGTVH